MTIYNLLPCLSCEIEAKHPFSGNGADYYEMDATAKRFFIFVHLALVYVPGFPP